MTMFLDLRAIPSGGFVAHEVRIVDALTQTTITALEFENRARGRNLVLATHGFNVNSEAGVASLSKWDGLCALPSH